MPDYNEVLDRLHYENRRDYTSKKGNVLYLDGRPLTRPFSMPTSQRFIALGILVVAVIIAFSLVNTFVISRWQEARATEQAIVDNLARPASIESIPDMASLINLNDDELRARFADAGLTMYDITSSNDSGSLTLYRVPADMTTDEVAAYFLQGFNALEAKDASRLFEGGWQFTADRSEGTSMVVRYIDFSTGDPQIAVQNAIMKEGFDTGSITESGEDDSGNTFSTGSFTIDDASYTWKVSALPLEEIYSISGLPEKSACYVGVRVTRS